MQGIKIFSIGLIILLDLTLFGISVITELEVEDSRVEDWMF